MPDIQFGISSYERAEGDLPGLPVINMYGEQSQSEGIILQSRPGLSDRAQNMGTGPVEALYKRDGVISGNLLGVSGDKLYNQTTEVASVAGGGPFSIAGNEVGVLVNGGRLIYSFDGVNFNPVAFPDDADVIKVLEGAGRFIALRRDSGKFYWTPPLAQTFDALDFATAESEADQNLDALFIDDILIIFGKESVEFWPNTGDNNLPFRPLEGRVIEKGIKATGCAAQYGSTFAWVTDENTVCLQDENNVISNPGLEERIETSAECRLFTFLINGQEFLALRLDGETQCWNGRTGTWSEFESYGQTNFAAQCFAGGVFGSATDGKTLEWGDDYQDLGGELERRFRAGFPIDGGGLSIGNLRVRLNPGHTPFLTGNFIDPQMEMRTSRDAAQTWSAWQSTSIGSQGDYRKLVEYRALGMASRPGFLAEFRVTDPVALRISGVLINERLGGR